MATTVDTEALLAEALRVLLPLAIHDEPSWLPREGVIERRRAYSAAVAALRAHDEQRPAQVRPIHSVNESHLKALVA